MCNLERKQQNQVLDVGDFRSCMAGGFWNGIWFWLEGQAGLCMGVSAWVSVHRWCMALPVKLGRA